MRPIQEAFDLSHFYKCLIESSTTGFIAININEKVVIFNQGAETMMGVKADDVLWQPFSLLLEKMGNTDSLLLDTLRNCNGYELIEATIAAASGPINVLAYTNLVTNDEGEVIGAYLGLRDITPQKLLEEQVFKNEKFSAFGELAAGIAHEVRNPLTSIRGFLQLFDKNLNLEDPNKHLLDIMLKEIERANNIIKQFLLLTKPVIPVRKSVDLHEIIRDVASIIEGESALNNVKVEMRISSSVPDVFLDAEQIRQVIINIAKNGIYAMPDGGVLTMETMYEAVNQRVHIIISDTGIGIESGNIEKLFDPFYTTRAEGTGLGLTVSYKIVQNHGGRIEVQSEINKGSIFRIILPVCGRKGFPS